MLVRLKKKLLKWKKRLVRRLKRAVSKTPKRKFYYAFFCKYCRIHPRRVLIESYHGKTVSDSGLVLAQEILKSYPGRYKIYFATENMREHSAFIQKIGLDVELIDVTTFKYTRILASAKYIFSNASLPIYFVKREGQTYLQTWHGTPLKTLGKKMRLGIESMYNVQHNFLQADYLTQPNAFTKDVIMGDYNLEKLYTGKVVMAGYPRNQIFMQPHAGKALRSELGLEHKTVYAYMPTWRGTSNHNIDTTEYAGQVHTALKKLDGYLKENQLLFVNFHPILSDTVRLEGYKHIRPFPAGVDGYTFLNCADVLITDYSSVFFDFSLTKKPVILFMYDYDEYMRDRGMCMDVKSLPFRQIYSTDELGECLREEACLDDDYTDTEYYKTFFKYDAPDISKKLLRLVFEGDAGDLEIIDYAHNKERKLRVLYPQIIKRRADFETLAHVADENTVVLMEKKWFKKDVSPMLHDDYNDAFNYVITTMTVPRTYIEDLLAHLGVKSVQRRLRRRDMQRTFPNLQLDGDYIRNFGCFKIGCNVNEARIKQIPLKACAECGGSFTVRFEAPAGYNLLQAAVLSDTHEFLSFSPVEPAENGAVQARFDLQALLEDWTLYNRMRCVFGVVAESTADKTKVLLLFSDRQKLAQAWRKASAHDASAFYYKPFIRTYDLPADYLRKNLKQLRESMDETIRGQLSRYDLTLTQTPMAVLPYLDADANGCLSALICTPDTVLDNMSMSAPLTKIQCKGSRLCLHLQLRGRGKDDIKGAVLIYRSKIEDVQIPLKMKVHNTGKGCVVKLELNLDGTLPLKEVYWDIRLLVNQFDYTHQIKLVCARSGLKWKLFFTNCQCDADAGHILFPYFGKKGVLCFCYRERSEYDTTQVRLKELIAYTLYRLFAVFWRRKKIWVVYEKFCKTAQDNGYYFFKYCMEQLPAKEKKRIFYVIDKRMPDYENIKQYEPNVIQFMSIRHMLYSLAMNICISSDSTTHLYVWRSKPSVVRRAIKKKKELFLQHGVTAMKQVHTIFGKKGSSPMTYFVTCSRKEHDIVVNEFEYEPANVPVTGFARWDVLEDTSRPDNRFILLMPTWRSWLEEVSSETFVQSDYYQNYAQLLTSSALTEMLERHNIKLVFYLHPKFADYIDHFSDKMSGNVLCVPFGQKPLNQLMMDCSMLITDYSSVCWDVLYQDKPVLFYQFDYEQYNMVHGSYIDMETELMGDRSVTVEELLEQLQYYIDHDFEEKALYKAQAAAYFAFRDNRNSKRIYTFLKQNGH